MNEDFRMAHVYNSDLDAFELYHRHQRTGGTSSDDSSSALPALGHAVAGSIGTATSNLVIYPLSLIVTRLQVQRTLESEGRSPDDNYKGVLDAAEKIFKKEGGIKAFYSGVVQDTGKSIADSFLFFLFYEYMRKSRLQKHGTSATTLPVIDELAVGAFSGALAKLFTAPISNIVTRKQMAAMRGNAVEPSVAEIIDQIRSEKGLQGFWSGYSAQLILTLNPSITFFLYETFKRTLLPRSRRDDPGARTTFLMAAMSKAIASAITYPFSLAKARAQASSKAPVPKETIDSIKAEAEAAVDEKNKDKARDAGHRAKIQAKRSTVFATILKIYRDEGLNALYEGVWGEVFKGFFSHGTTMLVKEAIHKAVIQLYLLIIKALGKTLAVPVNVASNVASKAAEVAGTTNSAVQGAAGQAGTAVSGAYEKATEAAGNVATGVSSGARGVVDGVSNGAQNVAEQARNGTGISSEKGMDLLKQAQETLSNQLINAGKSIKVEDVKKE